MKKLFLALFLSILCGNAFAAVTLENRNDELVLKDGKTISCTIVANGHRAVVVVVDNQEKIFARNEVRYIKRGKPTFNSRSFSTKCVDGLDVISGEATEEELAAAAAAKPKTTRKPKKRTTDKKARGKNKNSKSSPKTASRPNTKGKKSLKDMLGGKVSPNKLKELQNHPLAQQYIKQYGGMENAMKQLQANPALLKQLQGLLNR